MSTIRATYVQHGSSTVPNITLNASGQVIVASGIVSSGTFAAPSGSASAPGVYFDGDTNTGLYSPGADQLAISTNGVQRINIEADGDINIDSGGVFYDATNNRLAIGTTSPSQALQVTGNIGINTGTSPSSNGSGIAIYDASLPRLTFRNSTTGDGTGDGTQLVQAGLNFNIGNTESGNIDFFTANTLRASVDSSGRLLVGTSSSASIYGIESALQLYGTTYPASSISLFRDSSSNVEDASGILLARSRAGKTSVVSGDRIGFIAFNGFTGSTANTPAAEINAYVDGTPGANDMPGRLVFSTTADGASSPTERMRIRSDGASLFLSAANNGIVLGITGSSGTSNRLFSAGHSASGIGVFTETFLVWSNGDVRNTNNSYGAISDLKLKENIVDANSQWDDLKALRVRNYNLKEGQTHTQIGLIAQEVELVSPGLVSESPDRDAEGNDLGTATKSVNYSVLYMKAVKALQEAMERIETLEASNADLLARVTALENV